MSGSSEATEKSGKTLDLETIYFRDLPSEFKDDVLKNDGDFLLRDRSEGDTTHHPTVLSVFSTKQGIRHFNIPENVKNLKLPGGQQFNCLEEFILYYYRTGKPLIESYYLLNPIHVAQIDLQKIKLEKQKHLVGGNTIRSATLARKETEEMALVKFILGPEQERLEHVLAGVIMKLIAVAAKGNVCTPVDQKATAVRQLYSELPYVAVLDNDYVAIRCSHCFLEAEMPCPSVCGMVVYCNDSCATADQLLHQHECEGYRANGGPGRSLVSTVRMQSWAGIFLLVRLMGRLATRIRLDKGVAKVADELPKRVKSLAFADLKRAPRKLRKKLKPLLAPLIEAYNFAFAGTPLATLSKRNACRLFHILVRNIVHVRQTAPKSIATGQAIYLNKARFRNSCTPDLTTHLEPGPHWRLAISLIGGNGGNGTKYPSTNFNNLTLDHSRSFASAHNGYLTLSTDRKKCLANNFLTRCRCAKCRDPKAADLEENAAVYECEKCRRPYVWVSGSAHMKPSCRCEKGRKCLEGDQGTIQLNLELLNIQYGETMVRLEQSVDPDRVILQCEAVLPLGERYWHPVSNLRLAHLYSRLFIAYYMKVLYSLLVRWLRPDFKPDSSQTYARVWAETGVRMGESMLACFEYNRCMERHDLFYGSICLQIASLCCVSRDRDRFMMWLSRSKATFEQRGMIEVAQSLGNWEESKQEFW